MLILITSTLFSKDMLPQQVPNQQIYLIRKPGRIHQTMLVRAFLCSPNPCEKAVPRASASSPIFVATKLIYKSKTKEYGKSKALQRHDSGRTTEMDN